MSGDSFRKGAGFMAGASCFVVGAIVAIVILCFIVCAFIMLGPAIGNTFEVISTQLVK